MTLQAGAAPDPQADLRWREWQARGAEADRRQAVAAGRLTMLIALGLAIWLFVQLV